MGAGNLYIQETLVRIHDQELRIWDVCLSKPTRVGKYQLMVLGRHVSLSLTVFLTGSLANVEAMLRSDSPMTGFSVSVETTLQASSLKEPFLAYGSLLGFCVKAPCMRHVIAQCSHRVSWLCQSGFAIISFSL